MGTTQANLASPSTHFDPSGPVLTTKDLWVAYRRGDTQVEAVRGVDLTIGSGEFLAVVGPSGSGKSSLLRALAGLERPRSGEVRLRGQSISELSETQLAVLRRREIGFVHQFFDLLPDLSIAENVALPLMLDGVSRNEILERTSMELERLHIVALADRKPEEISGGEMLRAALARALVIRPSIILADEPTGSLDRGNVHNVLAVFREIHEDSGVTIALVTHDPEVAATSDRTLELLDGRVANT